MSLRVDQGYPSPPSSGRSPADKQAPRTVGPGDVQSSYQHPHHRNAQPEDKVPHGPPSELAPGSHTSPEGRRKSKSVSDESDRMLTPPLSRDTRMDNASVKGENRAGATASSSKPSRVTCPPASSSLLAEAILNDPQERFHFQQQQASSSSRPASAAASRLASPFRGRDSRLARGPVALSESDAEDNPVYFQPSSRSAQLHSSRSLSSAQCSRNASASPSEGDYEEEEAVDEITPRQSPRLRFSHSYRSPSPSYPKARVKNQDLSRNVPIRDSPNNPFIEGSMADVGFSGPNAEGAKRRARMFPGKERGKITYVFRGQRVTYADPEYDSDNEDDLDDGSCSTSRFQPKLLFPTRVNAPKSQRATLRGGLFAAELARREDLAALAPRSTGRMNLLTGAEVDSERDRISELHSRRSTLSRSQSHDARFPDTSMRRPSDHTSAKEMERKALLARLEQANWSDEEEERPAGFGENFLGRSRGHHDHRLEEEGPLQSPSDGAAEDYDEQFMEDGEGSEDAMTMDDSFEEEHRLEGCKDTDAKRSDQQREDGSRSLWDQMNEERSNLRARTFSSQDRKRFNPYQRRESRR
ncbi:hypothetical protein IE53DRAFT_259595 [Violaceomyces palustris]|uniref:Uncharacterized protein n=1 Tax=Violaceomyces palustris TaxID=1673888 RepID=A0ACD0NNB9_9BASI|nr:hypothetical protein IE53DRAFT_259595 [Violaceomyces palustris]